MRRLLLVIVVLMAVGTVTALVVRDDTAAPPSGRPVMTAQEYAGAACVRLRLVEQGVAANSAAATVRANLAEARSLAAEASRLDAAWVALSGGLAALDEAVSRNDGTAAATGLRVAREACRP